VSAGANDTYLFADGVHPSGAAHAMLARVVQATIKAPGQVSFAGEIPLQVYENHSNVINNQIFGMSRAPRDKGESNVFATISYGHTDYNPTIYTDGFNSNVSTATLGADVRFTDNISLGAALSFGGTRGDSIGHDIDGKEVLVSAYGVAHWGSGYVSGIISGGSTSLDIDRGIDFRASTRREQGDTSASHVAFELTGGFAFGQDDFRHGPYVSLVNQRVKVDGYSEDALDSTSMWFGDFTRRSAILRVGYQAQGNFGALQPFGRIAWAKEDKDSPVNVQAGSNTMNGHFTFPGYAPSQDWVEADVGLAYALNESTELSFAWRGHLSDDAQDVNTVTLGARWEFSGATPAPEPEPAVVETTCADADDDGDGVNNCDDKCPGSTAGEAMGADGCPVPAQEPVEEPKPFRN
jgi:outer membrane lipase/esterase